MSEFDEPLAATRWPREALQQPNVGSTERALSLAGGAVLLLCGLRRGGLAGLLESGAGALLAARGVTGRSRLKRLTMPSPLEAQLQRRYGWQNLEAISRSVTIARPRSEVYAFCRDSERLPEVIGWLDHLEQLDETRFRWTVSGPLGKSYSGTVALEEERSGERLVWALEEAPMPHRFTLVFSDAPHGRGTEVKVLAACKPPAGRAGYAAASLISRFSGHRLMRDLRRLKQRLETGEIPSSRMTAEAVERRREQASQLRGPDAQEALS
jgi:uncharacterized membrane protein